MNKAAIDLKQEQLASDNRPRYRYSLAARFFFATMDLLTGRKTTLSKTKLIETLASIPYRSWEIRQYARMTRGYTNAALVRSARGVMEWGREAQDNEYWHLLVINEKMKEDGAKPAWYLSTPVPFLMVATYVVLTRIMALFSIRRAFLFNAEFEDHAEHVYAQFVKEHPEWENQPVDNDLVREYGDYSTWADVFRRIGLDERDHMNNSFVYCGRPECVVKYDGMPPLPEV
jgi:demethoxyubiquinone hydroxylase (CLK1/Coq7/Cat5 family)